MAIWQPWCKEHLKSPLILAPLFLFHAVAVVRNPSVWRIKRTSFYAFPSYFFFVGESWLQLLDKRLLIKIWNLDHVVCRVSIHDSLLQQPSDRPHMRCTMWEGRHYPAISTFRPHTIKGWTWVAQNLSMTSARSRDILWEPLYWVPVLHFVSNSWLCSLLFWAEDAHLLAICIITPCEN